MNYEIKTLYQEKILRAIVISCPKYIATGQERLLLETVVVCKNMDEDR